MKANHCLIHCLPRERPELILYRRCEDEEENYGDRR